MLSYQIAHGPRFLLSVHARGILNLVFDPSAFFFCASYSSLSGSELLPQIYHLSRFSWFWLHVCDVIVTSSSIDVIYFPCSGFVFHKIAMAGVRFFIKVFLDNYLLLFAVCNTRRRYIVVKIYVRRQDVQLSYPYVRQNVPEHLQKYVVVLNHVSLITISYSVYKRVNAI